MNSHSLKITPISPSVGAEIEGIDIHNGVPKDQLNQLKTALAKYGVIFFRNQKLTPDCEINFAKMWGEININRFFTNVKGFPEIALVLKEPNQKNNIGGKWHTDHTYDLIPAMGSILFAHEVPDQGGDTMFTNMHLAYETLSSGLKNKLLKMKARHSSKHVFGKIRAEKQDDTVGRIKNSKLATQEVTHPVVIKHPVSGNKILYVNPTFTLGFDEWTDSESKPLLDYLFSHAVKPEFTCRFKWKKGSVAFWDNRLTWHLAINDYNGYRRLMHRITIEGEKLM